MSSNRERRSYQANTVIEALRKQAQERDAQLEEAFAILVSSLEDGVIDKSEERELFGMLFEVYKSNGGTLNITTIADESSFEAAQREVERLERRSRKD